jgi:hypothetical protein
MVHSPKLTAIIDDGHQNSLGKTICFESLEFIADRVGSLSLSTEGNDSGAVFVGMTHSRSPSLHTILEDSTHEFNTSSRGGAAPTSPYLKNAAW